ncbi:MAG: winged helix-turn-helix transcriptional regulator [Rhodospirillaceae bacterium]|nr:winged helix-turn-helix transcriptional regulator [Rhodospirillaceae bacterium]MBT5660316.1 winged helix-turn-helix transcriptional regulator [Rhodospirillaceae bacterium]MBT5751982.1 winged helix-turn-helix transcriptional regulator [Rhodospirillaceae bacterium]
MADINFTPQSNPPSDTAFPSEAELRRGMELLFFAYRDFTGRPDEILAEFGLGRAHHRVLYFVGRNPQINVNALLNILRITKQSLSRVLGRLVGQGYIIQHPGKKDRRQRLLELTEKGVNLEHRLFNNQQTRLARAYRLAGPSAVEGFWQVLTDIPDRPSSVKKPSEKQEES